MILRATVQIRHQGVLPHPPEGHRHLFTIVESKTAHLPGVRPANIACPSRPRRQMAKVLRTGRSVSRGHYLFATRYRDNNSPSSDGHRSLRGKRRLFITPASTTSHDYRPRCSPNATLIGSLSRFGTERSAQSRDLPQVSRSRYLPSNSLPLNVKYTDS